MFTGKRIISVLVKEILGSIRNSWGYVVNQYLAVLKKEIVVAPHS